MPQRFKKFGYQPGGKLRPRKGGQAGLFYDAKFLEPQRRAELVDYLQSLHPIWEYRFSELRPPPNGQQQRRLLRPVYWLGNWQFACLDYYRPPKGLFDRCVEAEPFPPVMRALVDEIEEIARGMFHGSPGGGERGGDDLPKGWELNTCLVNYYGRRKEGDAWVDTARVGEHKDFEPGPVASISVGERALFQFVKSTRPGERDSVEAMQWLDDGSLQIFGGDRWKKHLFHRVQRVDHKAGVAFAVPVQGFEVRRINLTFRYVPREHVVPVKRLSPRARADVEGYLRTLAQRSAHFAKALAEAGS